MNNVEFYWDDILVHTRTWEEHLKTLRELFRRLAQAGMTIRPSKCIFGVDSIDFLGHQLQHGLIGLHEDNVAKIRNAPDQPPRKRFVPSWDWRDITEISFQTLQLLRLPFLTLRERVNQVKWSGITPMKKPIRPSRFSLLVLQSCDYRTLKRRLS